MAAPGLLEFLFGRVRLFTEQTVCLVVRSAMGVASSRLARARSRSKASNGDRYVTSSGANSFAGSNSSISCSMKAPFG